MRGACGALNAFEARVMLPNGMLCGYKRVMEAVPVVKGVQFVLAKL